jgi:carboxylesterase type B
MALKHLSFVGLLLHVTAALGAAVAPPPIVKVGGTQYQGFASVDPANNATNTNFLGIRYAAAPTGKLRFAAPQAPPAVPGVQMANVEPNTCFNSANGVSATTPFRINARAADAPVAAEDCLFLNVFVPGNLGDKKDLPVVFWIHGGGYIAGSAVGFNGNDLIRESGGDVVAVVIQYRLGVFGFLGGQKVKNGGALNAGLLDQQFALQWVQQNIRKFGGDPTKVTIWGESAGAGSVMQQVLANGGKTNPPLFRAAISSSLFLPSQYKFNDPIPELLFSEVVSQTNCTSAANALACLRASNVNALQAANNEINTSGFFGTFTFVPVIDGQFITERPTKLMNAGKVNGDVLYAVTNAFEGTVFVNQASTDTVTDYVSQLYPTITPALAASAAAQYAGLGTTIFQKNAIYGESVFICPSYVMMRAFPNNAFKSEFAIPPALHGNDVAYYFPNGNAPAFANPQFDAAFSESFLDFARSLSPNTKFDKSNITPAFPLWNGSNEMLFNKTTANAPDIRQIQTSAALLSRCSFWESIAAQIAQ